MLVKKHSEIWNDVKVEAETYVHNLQYKKSGQTQNKCEHAAILL